MTAAANGDGFACGPVCEVSSEMAPDGSTVRLRAPDGAREGRLLCTVCAEGVLGLCAVPEGASGGDPMLFSTPPSSAGTGSADAGDRGGDDGGGGDDGDRVGRLVEIRLPPDAHVGERLLGRLPDGEFVAFKVPAVLPRSRRIRIRVGGSLEG